MCKIKASQIFKTNKETESMSKRNVLQTIKDTFDEMRAARAEQEDAASAIASARAESAAAANDAEDDLDSVDADRMQNMKLFLKSSIHPLKFELNFSILCLSMLLTGGRHLPTVLPTVKGLLRSLR
jgi:hypothetical protein